MSRQSVLVLTALADEPRHGYALLREVEALSGGQVLLRVGTLYGALERLAAEGLITVDREETVQGRSRRYWRLSEAGRGRVVEEEAALRADADAIAHRLLRHPVVRLAAT